MSDVLTNENESPLYSEELSQKAMSDYISSGDTTVVCPCCKTKPKYNEILEPNGRVNRRMIKCDCGNVRGMEIYL